MHDRNPKLNTNSQQTLSFSFDPGEEFYPEIKRVKTPSTTPILQRDGLPPAAAVQTEAETTIACIEELSPNTFVTEITVEDLRLILTTVPELERHHLQALTSLAELAQKEGEYDTFRSDLLIASLDPANQPEIADKIRALNEERDGFIKGPELSPHSLTGLSKSYDLVDIVRCFRLLGMEVTATSTPSQDGAFPVHWQLFYRPGSEANASLSA